MRVLPVRLPFRLAAASGIHVVPTLHLEGGLVYAYIYPENIANVFEIQQYEE